MRRFTLLLLLLAVLSFAAVAQDEEPFDITIIHTNDTHAAHLPGSNGNGGVAAMASVVKQIRAEGGNTLFLDAGDRFTGTLFHTQYKGQDQVQIMNLLGYNAMALGNHEFDNGDEVLAAFIDGLNFPVVSANIDFSGSELLNGKVLPYAILDVNGRQVGVIGLTTAETALISNAGDEIVFSDDYAGIVNAQAALLTEEGVNIIMVVMHVGIRDAEAFIPNLSGVDLVVDGHSHTLYSNTYSAASGKYPLQFTNAAGEKIYYVQAGANTQYVGRINMSFDAAGLATAASGDTIALSRYITPDEEATALVADLYEEVRALAEQPIGATAAEMLDGRREVCRVEECTMGNIIADSMRFNSGAQIAIMNGGGVRASIEPGDITLGQALTVQPFSNLLATFELTGANVILALENGVSGIVATDGVISREGLSGRFPQVSGIRYSYDATQEVGSRIVSVELDNGDGTFSAIEPDVVYSVVTNGFMRTGGDGYSVLNDQAINPYDFGTLDIDVTVAYMVSLGTVTPALEGRITIVGATLPPLE